jgi:hypothetical protein
LGFRVIFVAGALPPHPHKELSFLDLLAFPFPGIGYVDSAGEGFAFTHVAV